MKLLDGFTDQPKQKTTIILADGTSTVLNLEYKPNQTGWFFDLSWQDFALNGQRLTSSPNILVQYENEISFGLMIICNGNAEPLNQTDLEDGAVQIYLLEGPDLAAVAAAINPET